MWPSPETKGQWSVRLFHQDHMNSVFVGPFPEQKEKISASFPVHPFSFIVLSFFLLHSWWMRPRKHSSAGQCGIWPCIMKDSSFFAQHSLAEKLGGDGLVESTPLFWGTLSERAIDSYNRRICLRNRPYSCSLCLRRLNSAWVVLVDFSSRSTVTVGCVERGHLMCRTCKAYLSDSLNATHLTTKWEVNVTLFIFLDSL